MFYSNSIFDQGPRNGSIRALVSLTSAESKRLIAKGVAALPEVRRALERGITVIARGTTNAFVAEEITQAKIEPKCHYAAGVIFDGELCSNPPGVRMNPIVLRRGKPVNIPPAEALKEFMAEDVFIKGANAVDPEGNTGVLVAGETGGTIGEALPIVLPRGSYLIVPVGLEKLIPSVAQAARATGIFSFKYSTGLPVGLMPMPNALVVSEVQAFRVLSAVDAMPIAAGGIGGSEGCVVLSIEGNENQIKKAFSLVKSIKGEPAVGKPAGRTNPPAATLNYDAIAQWQTHHSLPRPIPVSP
ncbi:MAG: hypothetical protein HYX82_04265 [Chloroflexi bacterium]|nr:hypothetical protein [Chloroflexota bacterium]